MRAVVVPFSSIVGSSITLHDPLTDAMIGQLALLQTGGEGNEERKRIQIELAEEIAARINSVPAPILDTTDFQTLVRLKEDNTWNGARPVLERHGEEMRRAFELTERGLIALEQVAKGVRLHITRLGMRLLDQTFTRAAATFAERSSEGALIETHFIEGGFTEFINSDVATIARDIDGKVAVLLDMTSRKVVGYRVYAPGKKHSLDTDDQVFFYEQEFYVLSNFSAFTVRWHDVVFDTAEAAYHWEKFAGQHGAQQVAYRIAHAASAHEAFKTAQEHKHLQRPDWDDVKFDIMRDILRAKAQQHEYVRRKLLETGDRQLVENSWRDDVWGWGPDRNGQNMLGRLWMEIRAELRAEA